MPSSRHRDNDVTATSSTRRTVGSRRAPNSESTGEIPVINGPIGHRATRRREDAESAHSGRRAGRRSIWLGAAAAVAIAALGTVSSATSASNGLLAANFPSVQDEYLGVDGNSTNAVDVSRDYDRELAKQAPQQAAQIEKALAELNEQTLKDSTEHADQIAKQWVLPVAGYRLTARFGQSGYRWSSGRHTGLDFAGPSGSPIVSIAAGTVVSSGWEGAYGLATKIRLEDGTIVKYAHQSRSVVSAGQTVQPGTAIGFTGSTGNSSGPHLHLEVILPNGQQTDPYQAFIQHNVQP